MSGAGRIPRVDRRVPFKTRLEVDGHLRDHWIHMLADGRAEITDVRETIRGDTHVSGEERRHGEGVWLRHEYSLQDAGIGQTSFLVGKRITCCHIIT